MGSTHGQDSQVDRKARDRQSHSSTTTAQFVMYFRARSKARSGRARLAN